jgi:lipoprotein-releasing system permease protein
MKRLSWILFVSRRYFLAKRKEKSIASSALSVTGLALGTATLIVVIAVMNGFQSGFTKSIMEISSYHARLTAKQGKSEDLRSQMEKDPRVASATKFLDMQLLVRSAYGDPQSLNLRVLDKDALRKDAGLRQALAGDPKKLDFTASGSILLGNELFANLGLRVGDSVDLISIKMDGEEGLVPSRYAFTVAGTFNCGYYEYDRSWALCSFESAEGLVRDEGGEPLVGVKLKNKDQDAAFCASLAKNPPAGLEEAVSWREYNRVFFGALRIEKTIIMMVILLIPLVVAVNIFHSLRRSVFERHEEIGLLRALGASPRQVQGIFLIEGALIGLLGALIGLCLGLAITYNVNGIFLALESVVNWVVNALDAIVDPVAPRGASFSFFSPAFFYLSEVPVRVYFPEALFSFLFAFASSAGSAYLASGAVSRFQPQEILRYE